MLTVVMSSDCPGPRRLLRGARVAEANGMTGSFWFVRNVALLLALLGPALAVGSAVDWPLAWTSALAFALIAKASDVLMYRAARPQPVANVVQFEKALAAQWTIPETPPEVHDKAA